MPPAGLMSTSGRTATDGYPGSGATGGVPAWMLIDCHQANPVTVAISATPATIAGAIARRARGRRTLPGRSESSTMPPGVISYDHASAVTIGSPTTARMVSAVSHQSGRCSGANVVSATCSTSHMPTR